MWTKGLGPALLVLLATQAAPCYADEPSDAPSDVSAAAPGPPPGPHEPYALAFDADGFRSGPFGAEIGVPAARRLTFRYVASSEDAASAPGGPSGGGVRKVLLVRGPGGGLLARPADLPDDDANLTLSYAPISQDNETAADDPARSLLLVLRAMVRVPGDGGLPPGQQLWAAADMPLAPMAL